MRKLRGEMKDHNLVSIKRWHVAFVLLCLLCVIALSGVMSSSNAKQGVYGSSSMLAAPSGPPGPMPTPSPSLPDLGKIPIAFEPNAGQADPSVRYLAHIPNGLVYFTPSELFGDQCLDLVTRGLSLRYLRT
jgi:hypothetical protein